MKPLPEPKSRRFLPVLVAVAALALAGTARATPTIVLGADFNDKTVGLPIGTGGAAAGEPVLVNTTISAVVQELPLATPNLKINDSDLLDAGYVRFEFTNQWVITEGVVTISFTWLAQAYEDYVIRVRELRARSRKFLDLSFGSSANIYYTDDDTPAATAIGTYETNHEYAFVLTFDLDAGTYSVTMDGLPLLTDETHGVPYGIGAVLFGQQADEDDDGEYNLDDLVVTATQVPTPVTPATWAATKAAWR